MVHVGNVVAHVLRLQQPPLVADRLPLWNNGITKVIRRQFAVQRERDRNR